MITSIADGAITAEKNDHVIDAKEILRKSLDTVVLLGHANTKINCRRRTSLKKIFSVDSQSICDNAIPAMEKSKFLFRDDYPKAIKDARETAAIV